MTGEQKEIEIRRAARIIQETFHRDGIYPDMSVIPESVFINLLERGLRRASNETRAIT